MNFPVNEMKNLLLKTLSFFMTLACSNLLASNCLPNNVTIQEESKMTLPKRCVLFDKHHTRMTLAQSNPGNGYNWLFLAGGPGADSEYFNELIEILDLPGNVWLIDLPENGGNRENSEYKADYDFNSLWEISLKHVLNSMNNVILVGHSSGGMFALNLPIL